MSPIATPGSLVALLAAVTELEQEVAAKIKQQMGVDVTVYETKPHGQIVLPAIYNWWTATSPMETTDLATVKDIVTVSMRIATRYSEPQAEVKEMFQYLDIARDHIDPILHNSLVGPPAGQPRERPLKGTANRAWRDGFNTLYESFNDIIAFAFELPIRCELRRQVRQ